MAALRSLLRTSSSSKHVAQPRAPENNPFDRTMSSQQEPGRHKLVIGIDFGTTYTGVSWVTTDRSSLKGPDDVHIIQDWPGQLISSKAWKTPSRISYVEGSDHRVKNWGYLDNDAKNSYTWMKLLLCDENTGSLVEPTQDHSEQRGILRMPAGMSAVGLCADYLQHVIDHAWESIAGRVGKEILETTPLDVRLTVPAVWPDKAKNDTMRVALLAARQTRILWRSDNEIHLISEPEAAAIAMMHEPRLGSGVQTVKANDSITICDCGGGTVDVTTYKVRSTEPRLQFDEDITGIGGRCGSTYIDRGFIQWMATTFGRNYTDLPWDKRGLNGRFMREFEAHKQDFGRYKDAERYYEMTLVMKDQPSSLHYDADFYSVKVYQNEMQSFFDPVVSKILKLLDNQFEDDVKRHNGVRTIQKVMLVGGFSDSRYLHDAVRERCRLCDIDALVPINPQAAVVRGAAMAGLFGQRPLTRRARRHYGFSTSVAFDESKHDPDRKFEGLWDKRPQVGGVMEWMLKKGDVVGEATSIKLNVWHFVTEEQMRTYSTPVFVCDEETAPMYESDPGVRRLATIYTNQIDWKTVPSKRQMGGKPRVYQLPLCYYINFGEDRLRFRVELNGKEIAGVRVAFNSDSYDSTEKEPPSSSTMSDDGSSQDLMSDSCLVQ